MLTRLLPLALLLLPGCMFLRPATNPMPGVLHPCASGQAKGLLVFLPGLADGPDHFENNGFVEMVRQAHPDFDVLAADAHFGYYRSFSVIDRLHADWIAPIREKYETVWLAGISMGGFGSLAYALEHEVDGLILMAPYMGDAQPIAEVEAAGGLAAWQPPAGWQQIEDLELRKYYEVWTWLKGYSRAGSRRPKLFLGYGKEDRLRKPNGLLAATLPAGQRQVTSGGHDWTTWRPIFGRLLREARKDWQSLDSVAVAKK